MHRSLSLCHFFPTPIELFASYYHILVATTRPAWPAFRMGGHVRSGPLLVSGCRMLLVSPDVIAYESFIAQEEVQRLSKKLVERGTLKNPRREGMGVSPENPLGLKYIYRIEADWRPGPREAIGWRVKFPECHPLGTRSKSWYDDWHGGKRKTLEIAIGWRDMIMKKHDLPMTSRRLPVPWVRQSPTGVRGVYRHRSRQLYVSFVASSRDKYSRVHFGFGPNKMTEKEALVAAVRHRIAHEHELYGKTISKIPAWIQKALDTTPVRTTGRTNGNGNGNDNSFSTQKRAKRKVTMTKVEQPTTRSQKNKAAAKSASKAPAKTAVKKSVTATKKSPVAKRARKVVAKR